MVLVIGESDQHHEVPGRPSRNSRKSLILMMNHNPPYFSCSPTFSCTPCWSSNSSTAAPLRSAKAAVLIDMHGKFPLTSNTLRSISRKRRVTLLGRQSLPPGYISHESNAPIDF